MAANTFGLNFRLTTFGESHGPAVGCVVDGCPAGLDFDTDFIQMELDRRRPGQSRIVTQRKESDTFEVLSGVFEGKTTGAPIALLIRNENQRSSDYDHLAQAYRPGHADYTWETKYGNRDFRGGGRASARETAARVAGGAVAKLLLRHQGITINAWVSQVGTITLDRHYSTLDFAQTELNPVRCPDQEVAARMEALVMQVRKEGDTIGGIVSCVIRGCPAGLGQPVFDKLHADLGKAMLSINAVKGFEYGSGFSGAAMRGSAHNDIFENIGGEIATRTNHSGGIQGGISNGMDIYFRTAFKPVATIMREQETVDRTGAQVTLAGKGRHDPCVVPRAVPIVEAMAALIVADHLLQMRTDRL